MVGMLFFSFPALALAAVLTVHLLLSHRRERDQIFLRLLAETGGYLTVPQCALKLGLSVASARALLDAKARELGADFKSTEEGTVLYCFVSPSPRPARKAPLTEQAEKLQP
jgi:hypothetical protein